MVIKIGKLKIDFESRTSKHRGYLYNQIRALREEIIDIVLIGEARNRIPISELKLKEYKFTIIRHRKKDAFLQRFIKNFKRN